MGIYDRDYYRSERPGFSLGAPRSAVVTLILINAAVYLGELFTADGNYSLANLLSARVSTLTHPSLWWQFLTYGFVHDPNSLGHILLNMLALWFLGRDIEDLCGAKEFVRLYLVLLVVGGVAWAAVNRLDLHPDTDPRVLGASGAVTGVVVLYALNFPRRIILFMFVLPMPAWVFGLLLVLMDVLGATGWNRTPTTETNIAYAVHLAGAAFAFLYFQQGWNFGRLLSGRFSWARLRPRPRLRIHDPEPEEEQGVPEEEVDRILEKIHREGEASLTRKERRVLESASREYQRRRHPE